MPPAFAETPPGQAFGLNPALAVRAPGFSPSIYVIPGEGVLCLEITGALGGVTCDSTAEAEAGDLETTLFAAKGLPTGDAIVTGLVPNGVTQVTIAAGTSTPTATVASNVYSVELTGISVSTPLSLHFTALHGTPTTIGLQGG
jgi:hypothetical protein